MSGSSIFEINHTWVLLSLSKQLVTQSQRDANSDFVKRLKRFNRRELGIFGLV